MTVGGVRFEYLLDLNSAQVSYEALFHYPEGRRRRIFEREGNDLTLQRGLGGLAGTRSLLTDRSLALSIMRRFDEPSTSGFTDALRRVTSLGERLPRSMSTWRFYASTLGLFDVPQAEELDLDGRDDLSDDRRPLRARALSLLQLADLGITDVEVEERALESDGERIHTVKRPRLVHSSDSDEVSFDYREESAGTRRWFELIGPVLSALERGAIVLFDELASSLHPALTAQVVQLFQERGSNPNGAQLIFTTHDANLLNHLNRHEVWLTQKGPDGATRFAALSDFAGERVRRSRNIESGYLSGRFGALPDLSRPEILRELGLLG